MIFNMVGAAQGGGNWHDYVARVGSESSAEPTSWVYYKTLQAALDSIKSLGGHRVVELLNDGVIDTQVTCGNTQTRSFNILSTPDALLNPDGKKFKIKLSPDSGATCMFDVNWSRYDYTYAPLNLTNIIFDGSGVANSRCAVTYHNPVVAKGCEFHNFNPAMTSGVIETDPSRNGTKYENCVFDTLRGAALYHKSYDMTITGCVFKNIENAGNGGAISVADTGYALNISDSIFGDADQMSEGCISAADGGALYTLASTSLINCGFYGSRAVNGGAVAAAKASASLTVNDCIFGSCSATGNGDALYVAPTTISYSNMDINGTITTTTDRTQPVTGVYYV